MIPRSEKTPVLAYAAAIVGTFLIIAVLVVVMRRQTEPPPIDEKRMAERAKALAEIRGLEAQGLQNADWIDKGKGIVRVPIDVAMQRTVRAWQDPKAAKADLVARVQKATAQAPPPPQKPSEFE